MRVGIGFDIHPLAKKRKLVLGGVHVPFNLGLGVIQMAMFSYIQFVMHSLVLQQTETLVTISRTFPDIRVFQVWCF